MKNQRHNAILEIISSREVETQEDMIECLRARGYDVTQATVSRDIRELKLTKTLSPSGTYRYVKHQVPHHGDNIISNKVLKLNNAVSDSIISIDYSANIVVLKTSPGLGMAVASGIDAMNMENVLGCIGGDDTIMIVTRDEQASIEISAYIQELVKQG